MRLHITEDYMLKTLMLHFLYVIKISDMKLSMDTCTLNKRLKGVILCKSFTRLILLSYTYVIYSQFQVLIYSAYIC